MAVAGRLEDFEFCDDHARDELRLPVRLENTINGLAYVRVLEGPHAGRFMVVDPKYLKKHP